jgi:hypothetical protein
MLIALSFIIIKDNAYEMVCFSSAVDFFWGDDRHDSFAG